MASSNGEGTPSSRVVANGAPVPMDAEVMVATGRAECQQLKDLVNKETGSTTTMAVMMASSSKKDAAAEQERPVAVMCPLLLASVCTGDWKGLNYLLDRKEARQDPSLMPSEEFRDQVDVYNSSNMQRVSGDDIEQGADTPSLSAKFLLQGLTPEGDSALHMAAAHGNLKCASIIFRKDPFLLSKPNNKGDTPLHYAARAGNSEMVFHLIDLEIDFGRSMGFEDKKGVEDLLRKENSCKETALHEAIRIGHNDIVKQLMTYDPKLATFPEEGASPLYLSILLDRYIIARTLHDMSKGNILSYSGPDGQNALHAAVLRSKAMTGLLLEWNKNLTTQGDKDGSTPLHFASSCTSQNNYWVYPHPSIRMFRVPSQRIKLLRELLKANVAPLYQPDNCGMFPIHVAASVGEKWAIQIFVQEYPSSAGLRDKRGRTFLHVAVENKKVNVVDYACRNRSLAWILNMQDNDGNTALHLAVEAANLRMFCHLFGNRHIQLNLVNMKGQTPRDISHNKIPPGMHYSQSTQELVFLTLLQAGAMNGSCRQDHFIENYKSIYKIKSDDESKEIEKLKEATQSMAIGSVLIATVTFGATFALPGGYRADDHPNGGTPTLAGRYAFDAFVIANVLAFTFSSISTTSLLYSGSPLLNAQSRRVFLEAAFYFLRTSITCLTTTFTLGMYMVLAPVARRTAIAVCAVSPLVVLCNSIRYWVKRLVLAPSSFVRTGPIWTLGFLAINIVFYSVMEFWPLIFIFAWTSHGRNHLASETQSPVQAPAPLV